MTKDVVQARGAHAGGTRWRHVEDAQGQEQQALGISMRGFGFGSHHRLFLSNDRRWESVAEDSIAPAGDTAGPRRSH